MVSEDTGDGYRGPEGIAVLGMALVERCWITTGSYATAQLSGYNTGGNHGIAHDAGRNRQDTGTAGQHDRGRKVLVPSNVGLSTS